MEDAELALADVWLTSPECWPPSRPRQRTVLDPRFYQQMTQQEIGDRLGLSQVHISRLLRAALEALRVTHEEQRLIA